ncbi:MAG: hypothetical protein ACQEQF_12930 [Bacillota bacterium]
MKNNKTCKICKTEFRTDVHNKIYCSLACRKKNYYLKNKSKIMEYMKTYNKKNKDRINQKKRELYNKNRSEYRKYQREYYYKDMPPKEERQKIKESIDTNELYNMVMKKIK